MCFLHFLSLWLSAPVLMCSTCVQLPLPPLCVDISLCASLCAGRFILVMFCLNIVISCASSPVLFLLPCLLSSCPLHVCGSLQCLCNFKYRIFFLSTIYLKYYRHINKYTISGRDCAKCTVIVILKVSKSQVGTSVQFTFSWSLGQMHSFRKAHIVLCT